MLPEFFCGATSLISNHLKISFSASFSVLGGGEKSRGAMVQRGPENVKMNPITEGGLVWML